MKRGRLIAVAITLALASTAGPTSSHCDAAGGLPTVEVEPAAPNTSAPLQGAQPAQPRFGWMLWPLLQPGPLFTPDWWKGTWGGQLTLYNVNAGGLRSNIEIDVAEALGGVLLSSTTPAGPAFSVRGTPVLDATAKASGSMVVDERWQFYARLEGLVPTEGAAASGEASAGVGWKQDRSEVPWEGPVAVIVATGGVQPRVVYGFGEVVASWYLPAWDGGLIVVPTLIFATIVGPEDAYPADRLLSVANGASLQTRELLVTTIDASQLRTSFLGGSMSVRFPVVTFPFRAPNGMVLALYGSFNGWSAVENLIQRPAWMEMVPDGGLSAALAIVPVTSNRPAGGPFVVKVGSRFGDLVTPLKWRVDLLLSTGVFPTGPQSGIDWYW